MRATVEVVERELAEHGLVRRWTGARDGAFVLTSFLLADCLARAGELDRAGEHFERVLGHANDVGLLAEEIDPGSGALLGNFPQGLSHVGLVNAAWTIDRAGRGDRVDDGILA
jgi:GH15 family glucan-1,4-alpha-glucosidase